MIKTNFGFIPQVQEALTANGCETQATTAGRIVGDIISIGIGVVEVGAGLTIGTGGTIASCIGTACVGAIATVGVGVVVVANGGAVALNGAAALGNNVSMISGNSGLGGIFEKNNVNTTDKFWQRLDENGYTEKQAYNTFQNGKKYTNQYGQNVRWDPKTGLTLIIDPDDRGVINVMNNPKPMKNWELGWAVPDE